MSQNGMAALMHAAVCGHHAGATASYLVQKGANKSKCDQVRQMYHYYLRWRANREIMTIGSYNWMLTERKICDLLLFCQNWLYAVSRDVANQDIGMPFIVYKQLQLEIKLFVCELISFKISLQMNFAKQKHRAKMISTMAV